MEEKMFDELVESIRQGKAIISGEMEPSSRFVIDEIDVKAIRKQFNLSQNRFSQLLGISIGTLRNWEQGRRKPEGPARTLLRVAAKHPEAILDVSRYA
jgi:putative transcriptional regulator